ATSFRDSGRDNCSITVIHASGLERPAWLNQFVAGGKHCDLWPSHSFDAIEPAGCQHSDLTRANARAAPQQGFAARDIRACVGNELPGICRAPQLNFWLVFLDQIRLLDHYNRIGAAWNDAPGGDCGTRTWPHGNDGSVTTGDNLFVKRERLWISVTGAPSICCAQRKAIHVGPVERWCISCGHDVTCKHAGVSTCQRDSLGGHWGEVEMPCETGARFLCRDNIQKLLLPRGRTDARNQIAVSSRLWLWRFIHVATLTAKFMAKVLHEPMSPRNNPHCRPELISNHPSVRATKGAGILSQAAPLRPRSVGPAQLPPDLRWS